jgi:hypothetical protein
MPDKPELPRRRREVHVPARIDPAVPSIARMYNYFLGGKEHYPVDRIAAEKALAVVPQGRRIALANRYFMARAVEQMAEHGIDQFIDLGTGIPASPSVHETARETHPRARIVYMDNDPIVTTHNRALLATREGIAAIHGDIRQPEAILDHPAVLELIDFTRPLGVLMVAVLHFITAEEGAERIVRAFTDRMTTGSYLALSHVSSDGTHPEAIATIRDAYTGASAPAVFRPDAEIREFFAGFHLQSPGLIDVVDWFPYTRVFMAPPTVRVLGGLGRKELWRLP